jgi:hypothetical protein
MYWFAGAVIGIVLLVVLILAGGRVMRRLR